MKFLTSTFSAFVLILATTEISEAYVCKECEVGPQVLQYFHPPYGKKEDVGVCRDPCKMKQKLTDPAKIESARNSIYQCSRVKISCNDQVLSKYRTMDGSCNNWKNPSWGMSETCHRILLPHDYSDGVSSPRKSCLGTNLPPARVISNTLHRETMIIEAEFTLHFMEWGQTMAHDFTWTPQIKVEDRESCCYPYPKTDDTCMGEAVPPDDPFYIGKRRCLPFLRTVPCPLCNGSTLESLNKFTSYLDMSMVYGSHDGIAKRLRSNVDGKLRVQYIPGVGELPPAMSQDEEQQCTSLNSTHQCFLSGDDRISQNPMAASTHIILLRNHNNICRKLKLLNPHWDDEKLYQEARRINIAQTQYITFAKYFLIVFGRQLMSKFKLEVLRGNRRTKYNPQMDASTLDEVVSAADRYGHSFLPNTAKTVDSKSGKNSTLYLKDYFYYPFDLYNGLLDRLTVGMTEERARTHNLFYSSYVRDYLFHKRNEKTFGGTDLAATTIIRGRDHGLSGYSYYLKGIFNHKVNSFCDLRRFIPPKIIRQLRKTYESVHDIDLYTGGLSEYKVKGSILGPTFTSLVIMLAQKLKFGDRYYFEHGNQAGSFTKAQLLQIKKTTFSGIICETTNISEIQVEVFYAPSKKNPVKKCKSFPELDLSPWSENYENAYGCKRGKFKVPFMPVGVLWRPLRNSKM